MATNILMTSFLTSYILNFLIAVIALFKIDRLSKCTPHVHLAKSLPYIGIFVPMIGIYLGVISQQLVVAAIIGIFIVSLGIALEVKLIFKSQPNHKWNDCKCTRCGLIRDEQHDFDEKNCTCRICGKENHDLVVCDCRKCGQTIHAKTIYGGCKCVRCGVEIHLYSRMKCIYCNEMEPHEHVYLDHYCTLCSVFDGYWEPEFNGG